MIRYLKTTFLFLLLILLIFGNARAGKAQSETDWAVPINISKSGISRNPTAVVDYRGVIHVIWIDEVDGYRYSSSADNITWKAPMAVKFPFTTRDYTPVFLADPNGPIYAFWITEKQDLFYSKFSPENFDRPSNWSTSKLGTAISNFDVAIDSQGALHIAYIENVTNALQIAGVYYRRSVIGNGDWTIATPLYYSEYFRLTTSLDTYIRISIADKSNGQKIYVTWDDRPKRQIFLTKSDDQGRSWSGAQIFKGAEDTKKQETPFNFSIWARDDNILVVWQEGESNASRCLINSQWSTDEGRTWEDTITLFGGPTTCPSSIKFIYQRDGRVSVLLSSRADDPRLIAWDGSRWSDPQPQFRLPTIYNPETYAAVLLGCRQDLFYMDRLFVVGCDQYGGNDIWFLSRPLVSIDKWFSPLSVWNDFEVIENKDQKISSLTSATDEFGVIHRVWVQTYYDQNSFKHSIIYSTWAGKEWTDPRPIIQGFSEIPLLLTIQADSRSRLLLTWVDSSSGDIQFTWASIDQAGLSSEWAKPTIIPSPSHLVGPSDIVVDAIGRIVVAYVVRFNEYRGVYIVQSNDNGATWSLPVQVFDGQAAQWDAVESSQMTLGSDGILHILITRGKLRDRGPVGLYYSQSKDGGITWSDPDVVSDDNVSWSRIVAYGSQTVLRLWQEDNGLVVSNLSQESQDGGLNWGPTYEATNATMQYHPVALALSGGGKLHLVQLVKGDPVDSAHQESLTLRDWEWSESKWSAGPTVEININGAGQNYAIAAGITENGYLNVTLLADSIDVQKIFHSTIYSLNRYLDSSIWLGATDVGELPTPFVEVDPGLAISSNTPDVSQLENETVLADDANLVQGVLRNLVGVLLIGVLLLGSFFLLRKSYWKK